MEAGCDGFLPVRAHCLPAQVQVVWPGCGISVVVNGFHHQIHGNQNLPHPGLKTQRGKLGQHGKK